MLKTYRLHLPLAPTSEESGAPSLSELLSALSFALDLTEGAVPGHALRSCLLGMRLGRELGFVPGKLDADCFQALSSVAETLSETKPPIPANVA